MGASAISLGLGLGGGKSATSSGTSGGGGTPFVNLKSVSFDGSDDYLLMGTSAISLDTNFTISVWFKPTSDALSGYDFMCGWGNAASGQSRAVQILNSKLSFEIYFSRVSGATTLSVDTWYHGAVTFSGNDVEIFLNGSSDGTGTLSRSSIASSLTFAGGTPAMTGVGFAPFSGLIDEFAVFDSVLSNTEITAIYNGGVPNDIGINGLNLNPVGWWRMGDGTEAGSGTTVFDMSSNSNNGTLTNGPTFSRNVPYNYFSISLDGTNDYIDCGGASDFSFNNGSGTDSAFSISAWVKFDNINRARAVSKDNGTGSREYLFGTNNSNKVNMLLGDGFNNLDIQNNATINTNDWFHIVATYDGSKSISGLKVYVNADASNLSDVSAGTYSGMPQSTGNLNIGRFGKTHSVFDGLVDEVAVFSKELTASDVTNIYNTGFPNDIGTNGLNLDPLGWWRMGDNDGGTGTTVTDQGSGGNNGTLNNIASPNGFVTDVPT